MPSRNQFLVMLSRKAQEIIGETDNLVTVATTYRMSLPSRDEQVDSQQLDVRQVKLITDGGAGNYISVAEASKISKMSTDAIKKLVKSGTLVSKSMNGETLISRSSLHSYLGW